MKSFKRNGTRARVVLLIGPPGSGKGTQGALLAQRLRVPVLSTGEMLRREICAGTPLGMEVSSILDHGGLVSDDLINRLVAERLRDPDCSHGVALDGYPRTAPQAHFLDRLLDDLGLPRPTVLHLVVPGSTLIERLAARRHCSACGRVYNLIERPPLLDGQCDDDNAPLAARSDDRKDVITERLKAYERASAPLLRHYQSGDYHRIDGDRPLDLVLDELSRILEQTAPVLQVQSPKKMAEQLPLRQRPSHAH